MERPAVTGSDAIVNVWSSMNDESPYWSLWYNSKRLEKWTQYNGDSLEESKDYLLATLRAIEQTGDTLPYGLRMHPDTEKAYSNNSPVISALPCRLNPSPAMSGVAVQGPGMSMQQMREQVEMEYEVKEMRRELAEIRATMEDFDNEPMEPVAPTDTIGRVIGFIEKNPSVMGLITQFAPLIQGFMSKLAPVSQNNAMSDSYAPAINGVPDNVDRQGVASSNIDYVADEAKLNAALDRLEMHCHIDEDLTLLANMADNDPATFTWLLGMLRKG